MNGIISLVTPLLLHMIVSEVMAVLLGGVMDSTSCTAAASLIVIPIAGWMYFCDRRKSREINGQDTAYIKNADAKRSAAYNPGKTGDISSSSECVRTKQVYFGIFCFLAGGILNLAWSGIMNLLHITQAFSNQTQEQLLSAQLIVQVIGLGLLVPAAEELVFRGLIYTRMKQFFPVKLSVLFSALLFAVYHGNPIQMIFAFPMAIALAMVYERGNRVLFPVLFHMGANLTAILVNYL